MTNYAPRGPCLVVAALALVAGVSGCGSEGSSEPKAGGHAGHDAGQAGNGEVSSSGYTLVADNRVLRTGRPQIFRFSIEAKNGRRVRAYEVRHTQRMHLIVVSRDLSEFQHVHPTLDADGRWAVRLTLPRAGVYRAFADFKVGEGRVLGTDLFVPGAMSVKAPPRPDTSRRVAGYDVYLSRKSSSSQRTNDVTFTVIRNGRPVRDLQPYLGARGHLVVLREGDLNYLHVHPKDGRLDGIVSFAATFPSAGRYRLFMQFRHRDVVRTAPFTIALGRGAAGSDGGEPASGQAGDHADH